MHLKHTHEYVCTISILYLWIWHETNTSVRSIFSGLMNEVQFASAGAQVAALCPQQCQSKLKKPMFCKPKCPVPKVIQIPEPQLPTIPFPPLPAPRIPQLPTQKVSQCYEPEVSQCPIPQISTLPTPQISQFSLSKKPLKSEPFNSTLFTECYAQLNQKGKCTLITTSVPDLQLGGFDNIVRSVMQNGRYVVRESGFCST